jgi:hypothetical protein
MFKDDPVLTPYFADLLPVLRILARQADPATPVDTDFWKSLYKMNNQSGANYANGWITSFLAHIQSNGRLVPRDYFDWNKDMGLRWGGSVPINSYPTHVSAVPFIWDYFEVLFPMRFIGGILAVDDVDGFMTPRLSYGILKGQ